MYYRFRPLFSNGRDKGRTDMYKHMRARDDNSPKIRDMAFAPHRVALYLVLAGLIINTLIK